MALQFPTNPTGGQTYSYEDKTWLYNNSYSAWELDPKTVYLTGNQNISGVKSFYDRPLVNGTGVMLSGEAAPLPTTIVYQTGDQTISGSKLFIDNLGIGQNSATAKVNVYDATLAASGSLSGSAFNIAQTWNTSGTPTAIKLNVTDTASNAASLLMDLQVGGASKTYINKKGGIRSLAAGQYSAGEGIGVGNEIGMYYRYLSLAGNASLEVKNGGISLGGGYLGWGTFGLSPTLYLYQDNSNILAQRNGTNAQTFRIYGTYTSSTNFERLNLRYNSTDTAFQIGTEKGSAGGTARALELQTDDTTRLKITTAGDVGINKSSPTEKLDVNGNIVGNIVYEFNGVTKERLATQNFAIAMAIALS